jgi:hypothetical protein
MCLFYDKYNGKFKSEDLAKALRRITPMEIITSALPPKNGKDRARVILRAYNWKRNSRRLEDAF